ncbi:MAG: tagatose 1,6-diphosphate aldolase [Sphingopyxis sp.]|nr:tagatose 1,6-diphosphate aldolase [Sphingopyxis sp.]
MKRMADAGGRFKMTAVDQRPPIKNPIKAKRGTAEAPWADVAGFKELLIEELQAESSAMLLDPHYAYPRGVTLLDKRLGLIVTLEDSLFKEAANGSGDRYSAEIDDWSVEKIKRIGGDAVKVLTWYCPDGDPAVCRAQQEFTQRVGEACRKYDLPYVFELLVYPLAKDEEQTKDYVEMRTKHPELVLESVRTFADPKYGVDLFKLESPLAAADVPGVGAPGWEEAQRWFDALGWQTSIRRNVDMGGAETFTPDSPTVLTFYIPFLHPDLPGPQQGPAGRAKLFATSYADFERQLREQLTAGFAAAGFDAKRDIAGIILTRCGHAYVAPQPGFYFGRDGAPPPSDVIRKPHGRIVFAHSELLGEMAMAHAMHEAHRAAGQVMEML